MPIAAGDSSTFFGTRANDGMVAVTRAALCQVYDSIFMDVPMSRVKFNVNTEYAYIQNFKILQSKHCLLQYNCPLYLGSLTFFPQTPSQSTR
jgi:hypothetical protein